MSARNISLGGKGGRCVGMTTLTPSCADCHEIWEPKLPGTLRVCPGLYRNYLTSTICVLNSFKGMDSSVQLLKLCAYRTTWFLSILLRFRSLIISISNCLFSGFFLCLSRLILARTRFGNRIYSCVFPSSDSPEGGTISILETLSSHFIKWQSTQVRA
jgi:hypothetical protein